MEKTVLIAEDFATSRNVIKFTLEKKGFKVLEAEDGREAMKYFTGQKIDLVITDYNMPNKNGAELAEYIRTLPQYRFVPILVLSTETNTQKKERASQAQITGWIKKPFDVETLMKFVNKALK